jgi:protease I
LADIVRGKRVTSVPNIKDAMINAGATWVDESVVRDDNLITSRTSQDLPFCCKEITPTVLELQKG